MPTIVCRGTWTRNTKLLRKESRRLSSIFMVLFTQGRTAGAKACGGDSVFFVCSVLSPPTTTCPLLLYFFPTFALLPTYTAH